MKIVAISNQKGGCGKTTTAINLASSLALLGRKTLLIDLDPQAHATFGLGIRSEQISGSMFNVLTEQSEKKKKFLEDIIIPIEEGLDLAPSHILLSTIEQEFTNKDESVSRLYEVLQTLSFPYEFVIIDCPPSLGFLTFNALRCAHLVIVPVELSSFSLMGVDKLLSMIELIRVKLQHTPKVLALPTIVDMRSNLSKHMMDQIRETFGDHVLSTPIRQTVAIRESQMKGVSLLRHSPKCKGAIDYLVLSQEVLSKVMPDSVRESMPSARITAGQGDEVPNFLRDFSLNIENAQEVHVVGDFNNWSVSDQSKLWENEKGVWQKRVYLEPGKHRYKFIIDGNWVNDPSNDTIESNPYGGMDSVVEIH